MHFDKQRVKINTNLLIINNLLLSNYKKSGGKKQKRFEH